MNVFIDHTVFLGMHSVDEATRIAAKNFFVEHFDEQLFMTLEDVGKCDDVIWQFGRTEQDLYYPFMDRLHTVMDIQRVPYSSEAIVQVHRQAELSTQQQLVLSMAEQQDATIVTLDTQFARVEGHRVRTLPLGYAERDFNDELEQYYSDSLVLRV